MTGIRIFPGPVKLGVNWTLGPVREVLQLPVEVHVMSFRITAVQKFPASVAFTDAKNNPAPVDGKPSWATSNPELLDLQVAADGLSVVVTAKGPIGTAQVSVVADADLGEGVKTILGQLDVEVVAGVASVVSITPGGAQDQ